MKRRGRSRNNRLRSLLLGTTAVLILCFAVFVAFRATHGLPFVPTYNVRLQVPAAAEVVSGDDVTIAGLRVGQVTSVTAVVAQGQPTAQLNLAIEPSKGPLPDDTRFAIQLTGSIGRKAVAIFPGRAKQTLPGGVIVPVGQVNGPSVDLDQVLGALSAPARAGAATTLQTLGLGFAGRGTDLNDAIGRLPGTLSDLGPVMHSLATPSTGLARFVVAFSDLAGALAPVAQSQASLVTELSRTFGALASVAHPFLESTIAKTPDTLAVATRSLQQSRPFLRATATLMRELEPATAQLPAAAPVLAGAVGAGARSFPQVPALSRRLATGLSALARFGEQAPTRPGVVRLSLTADTLQPLLAYVTPAETTCSYMSLLLRNLASVFEDHVATGTLARVSGVVVGTDRNSERGPSNGIYTGKPATDLGPLHSSPYPYTASPGQVHECEAGYEPYVKRVDIGHVPGLLPAHTEAVSLP